MKLHLGIQASLQALHLAGGKPVGYLKKKYKDNRGVIALKSSGQKPLGAHYIVGYALGKQM